METVKKITSSVTAAPIGAVAGTVIGYLVAKQLGYEKTITVISFTVVGLLIGSAVGYKIKNTI